MIEFGPNGPMSPMFASGRDEDRTAKRFRNHTAHPDSSVTLRMMGVVRQGTAAAGDQ